MIEQKSLEDFFHQVCSASQDENQWWCTVPQPIQEILIALSLSNAVTSAAYIQELGKELMFCGKPNLNLPEIPVKNVDRLQNKARQLMNLGVGVIYLEKAKCNLASTSEPEGLFLFVKNIELLPFLPPVRAAFFQSRTSRQIDPFDDWLQAFVYALDVSRKTSITYVSSSGTAGYDIVTTWCMDRLQPITMSGKTFLPFIMIHPFALPLNVCVDEDRSSVFLEASCVFGEASCHKRHLPACRDLIVSSVSSHQVAIKLRPNGTLAKLLTLRSDSKPKAFWLGSWKAIENVTAGAPSSENSIMFWEVPQEWKRKRIKTTSQSVSAEAKLVKHQIDWSRYLYHYTRGSQGPLSGETRREYIRRLLSGDPLSGNKAIDVLISIAKDGKLRASSGMHGKAIVRGGIPVVCWTAVPPVEIHLLRRWNRTLARWTVEPYGIAVLRTVLKRFGTRPVCYLPAHAFDLLPKADQYRFQKHEPPGSNWKHEREWRTPCDVPVDNLKADEAFWFVARLEDALKFASFAPVHVPIYVMERGEFLKV